MAWTLHLGDCLEYLRTLPDGSVDAVVTDPPYGINTKSDGAGKISPWGDLCNAAYWYSAWISECRRILKPTGALWSFLNWRSLVTFQKAACDLRWPIESLLVWNKDWIGPGGVRGLRPAYELVAMWPMPEFSIVDRGLPDIQTFKWCGHKPSGHPAEKPSALCEWLIVNSMAEEGAMILDPFAGSGTTGVAALRMNRNFIGCEISPEYHALATRRLKEAEQADGLFVGRK